MNFKDKIKTSIMIVVLPSFMIFLLGPTEIYYSNLTDFTFLYKDFIYYFLFTFVILSVILSLLLSILPEQMYKLVISILTISTVIAYIQNMFFNIKISEKDGSMMKWSEMKNVIVVNTIIWILLFVVLLYIFCFNKKIKEISLKICKYITGFLFAIQLVAFVSIIVQIVSNGDNFNHYLLDGSGENKVATDENIIVLCLDSVDSQLMKDTYEQDSERYSFLNDFTLYTNYDSNYMPTFPSVTHLLTGIDADAKESRLEYNAGAWTSERANEFYDTLHEKGYLVNLYVSNYKYVLGDIEYLQNNVDNVVYDTPKIERNNKLLAIMLEKMTLYRYAPYVMKPFLEVDMTHYVEATIYTDDDYDEDNFAVYTNLMRDGVSLYDDVDKAFIYKHIRGIHIPYDITENGEEIWTEDYSREDVYKGVMLIVENYINGLKEVGVYDNSTIIILADHNQNWHPEMVLFMIKRAGENHDSFVINHAPICSNDFQPTILNIIGEDYLDFGTTIYDWNEGDERERWHFMRDKGIYGFKYIGDGEEMLEESRNGYDYEYDNVEW